MPDDNTIRVGTIVVGSYHVPTVLLSVVLAILGAYAGFTMSERVALRDTRRAAWLASSATAIAVGIWAMHYTGMLALRLPFPTRYHWPTVLLSFAPALLGSFLSVRLVTRSDVPTFRVWAGGAIEGAAAISGLHYTSMASMRHPAMHVYSTGGVVLSVLVAIALSVGAFGLRFRNGRAASSGGRFLAALVMGAAISGMHYSAMAALSFRVVAEKPDFTHAVGISTLGTFGIVAVCAALLFTGIGTAWIDRERQQREQLRALAARVEAAREEERIRLAREIHDELGQRLTALKLSLASVERRLGDERDGAQLHAIADRVVEATAELDALTNAVQEIAAQLRPGVLDKLGLGAALQYECRRLAERTGVRCEVRLPEREPTLPSAVSTALFRVFQECLTNVIRHANATNVVAELDARDGWVTMRIQDDGRGLSAGDAARPDALGLLGMRERVQALGGRISFDAAPGRGTLVTARVPL